MNDNSKPQSYQIDDLVWAKLRSYRFWPGRIMEPKLPELLSSLKRKTHYCVFFFGTNNFGWVKENDLKPYHEFQNDENLLKKPNNKLMEALYDIKMFIIEPEGFSELFGSFDKQSKSLKI